MINPLYLLLITFDSDYCLPVYALNILLISLYVISTGPAVINPLHILLITFDSDYYWPGSDSSTTFFAYHIRVTTTGPTVINPLHILLITFDSDYY